MHAEDTRPIRQAKRSSPSPQSPTFLERFFSFLFGANDPERERKRLLKEIEHQLRGVRHHFYRPKTEEALVGMAKFFHELYTIAGPAQLLVDHAESSEVLKIIIIEQGFTERQRELHDLLTEEGIKNRASEIRSQELETAAKEMLTELLASFDAHQVKEINQTYNLLAVFLDIIHFDYYFLLKKFDSHLRERDFRYTPHFDAIQVEHVLDDLKDFLSLLYVVDPQADWKTVLGVLKTYRGVDVITPADWNRLLRSLVDVRRSQIFELCVRHASKNPHLKVKVVFPNEKVVEDYLTKLQSRTEATVQKLVKQQHDETVEKYTAAVFGSARISRAKYYTVKNNVPFKQRMLGGYTHAETFNCLQAFLLEYFKHEIRELVDLLIVRGRWATQLTSQQLSESFHLLQEAADEARELDDGLAEEGEQGGRIKSLIWKADRDRTALRILRETLKEINEQAAGIVSRSVRSLIVMGKSLRVVLDDYDRQDRELLTNWREIESASGGTIRAKIVDAYKKIYYLVQLIQLYLKKESSP